MNKEKLRERCYEMGNSQLPVDVFYNDITQNTNPRFNKLLAYCDLEKIVNYIEDLQKENQELRERYKHRAETSNDLCKAVKQYEKAFEFLEENYEIVLHYDDEFPTPMISINGVYSYINEEQCELFKEVLSNER